MTAILLIRDVRHVTPGRFAIPVCICASAYLLLNSNIELGIPIAGKAFLLLFNLQLTICSYWFGRALLEDNFRLTRYDWLVFITYFFAGIPYIFAIIQGTSGWNSWSFLIRQTMSIMLVAHLLYSALSGRSQDLIESRRLMRGRFAVAICLVIGFNLAFEIYFQGGDFPMSIVLINSFFYVCFGAWGLLWVGRLHPEVLMFEKPVLPARPAAESLNHLEPKEKLIHDRLVKAMTDDVAYAEHGLAIRTLAKKIDAPEHQLRALINKTMGHRNFSAFLNSYRIDAAKAALINPEKAQLPVLTIAMDVGYASLAPFNRAFRELVGETPTAFRKKNLLTRPETPINS